MTTEQIASLQIGDRVGYGRLHQWGTWLTVGFGTVTKINGYGHVTVETEKHGRKVFDKYGEERGRKFGGALLRDAAWLEADLAQRDEQRATNAAVGALVKAVQGRRTGMGDYHITAEQVAAIKALTESLTK